PCRLISEIVMTAEWKSPGASVSSSVKPLRDESGPGSRSGLVVLSAHAAAPSASTAAVVSRARLRSIHFLLLSSMDDAAVSIGYAGMTTGAGGRSHRAQATCRITRQGLPAAKTPSGTSRATTLPAPITEREPIVTPGRMIAPPPTHRSSPIVTGLPHSLPLRATGRHGRMGG